MNAERICNKLNGMRIGARAVALVAAGAIYALGVDPAAAAVTNDREYSFGDAGTSDPDLGATVSDGAPLGFDFSGQRRTADDTGPGDSNPNDLIDDSAFRDLIVENHPNGATYADASGRPLASAGEFAARFDGVDDILTATPLNVPAALAVDFLPDYPFNYDGLEARGLQMWVRPDQAGLEAGVRQTIVMDTVRAGGVAITADGKWDQIFDSEFDEGDIAATVPVVGDTWYHVMQHIHPSDNPGAPKLVVGADAEAGFTSVVYVDGVAVSASNDDPTNEQGYLAGDRVGRLTVGGAELPDQDGDPNTADLGQYFDGTIDDLRLYVFGDNTALGGEDYGSFDLFADNDWIANEIAATVPGGTLKMGDVNRDGAVTVAGDVQAFVDGWLSQNVIEGFAGELITVGDWNTWAAGDMNLDGRVTLADWALINAANPSVGAAIGAALQGVPEPTALALAVFGCLAMAPARRRRA